MRSDQATWTLVTKLGLTVVLTLLIFLFLGIWLDGFLGSRWVMTLALSMIGMFVALWNCYRMVMDAYRQIAPEPKDQVTGDRVDIHRDTHGDHAIFQARAERKEEVAEPRPAELDDYTDD